MRLGIRNYHELPAMNDLKLDLQRVDPMLSREWRDVFDLYSMGYQLDAISAYWQNLFNGRAKGRNYGSKIIARLVEKVDFYLNSYVGSVDGITFSNTERLVQYP